MYVAEVYIGRQQTKYNNCNYLEIKDECNEETASSIDGTRGKAFCAASASPPSDDYYRSWMHLFVPLLLSYNS